MMISKFLGGCSACGLMLLVVSTARAQTELPIGLGWARTKVNTTIFRHSGVCSHGTRQVVSYYDAQSRLIIAERQLNSTQWTCHHTKFTGHTADAHNGISMAFDGDGFLHIAWDHHGNRLRYARTVSPEHIEFDQPSTMVGTLEDKVTYPEFYRMPGGDLIFFYRHGASGNGNLVFNRYDVSRRRWTRVQDNLIDGEGQRNAYWQVAVDGSGGLHLSWVWRETGDVTTNHDIAYALSRDGGKSWLKTTGESCRVPITEAGAEYAARIPQNSELANQTSMAVDSMGNPHIANFWRERPAAVPQYWIVSHDGSQWSRQQIGVRTLDFHRRGGGTKRPPISRPLLLLDSSDNATKAIVLFRDSEKGDRMNAAICGRLGSQEWKFRSITQTAVGQSDPIIDPDMWASRKEVHLFTQRVGQGDGEKEEDVPPQLVSLTVWTPE